MEETMMPYPELFAWWALTITWSSVFLTLVSLYLYIDSSKKRKANSVVSQDITKTARDFVFVWVLLGLLILYIVSIDRGSAIMFAAGNILVEVFLTGYILKNRTKVSEQETRPPSR